MATPAKSPDSTVPSESQFSHGAEWVRVDFHLHTAADREFKYTGDPDFYNSAYVEALSKAGVRLGIITNHNKFDLAEFEALRSTAKKAGIGLLPGIELSVGDASNGIHTLVVFSDDWLEGHDYINPFLGVAFEGKAPAEYESGNGRSTHSLEEILRKLEGKENRDFFVVFAHVEEKSGLWKEMGGGRMEELGRNEYFRRRTLGFQKVRTHDGAGKDKPCRTKVQQWLGNWYPAEVEGSDPKSIEDIGQGKTTFVKLGDLSFDALKFALCDPAHRVTREIPKRTTSFIRSVHFEGGTLNGKTVHFSPELNTLIGIRGSGKSSILEAIRYVLDIPRGEKALDTKYKEDLIRHTLGSGGKIILTATDTYGQEFTISRIYKEPPNVYLGGQLKPGISIRETILRRPIYFGQKDLSSTGEGFETDLVEKLAGEKLGQVRADIAEQRERVREAARNYLKLQNTAEQKQDYANQLQDAELRLQKFTEFGIAGKLEKRLGYQQDAGVLSRIGTRVKEFVQALSAFIADHEDDLRNATAYQSALNGPFFAEYFVEYARLIQQLDYLNQIAIDVANVTKTLESRQAAFNARVKELQEEFAAIERQLAQELQQSGAVAIQPDEFLVQQQRKTKAEQMIAALTKQETKGSGLRNVLLSELDKLNELWLKEFNAIKSELDRVNDNETALQISAELKGDKEASVSFLQQLFRGTGTHANTLRAVMADYADFGALYRDLPAAKSKAGSNPDTFESTILKNLADLITWQVPNRFVISYRGRELKHHSLGQRASALILYVLSQRENDVIIIDQPEDDLDNQTIYDEVIKLIRQMKSSIQFIFATHNPNFPVLGDAEQIHACRYEDDQVHLQSGSIDSRRVQDAVINIMEGGEEAFRRRKEVYSLWKPQSSSK